MPPDLRRKIQCGCDTGAWISVLPSPMAGTELSADEFCDSLSIHYASNPTGLQPTCDGCGEALSARHTFSCVEGSLVIICHKKNCHELCDMSAKSFTPSAVHNEPKINLCCAAKEGTCKPSSTLDYRGDVPIRGLWEQATYCILDVRVTDTDAKTYKDKDAFKVLKSTEKLTSESMRNRVPTSDDTSRPL
jgi:hypothetical protein